MSIFFSSETVQRNWMPRVDIYRTGWGWVVKLDLAGVRSHDAKVECQGCSLIVSGVRRDWVIEEDWRQHSMEISYTRFRRVIEMPCQLGDADFSVDMQDGMMLVKIKTGEARK